MALQTIDLGYRPRSQFVPFHKRTARWSAIVAHRRAGKTVATVADLIDATLRTKQPNARGAYVAPTFVQAKDVAWEYLKRFSAPIPGVQFNESELRVDYPTGARIRLYGADNADRMRGLYFDHVVMDEYADMNPSAWNEVIRPALADRKGHATFIGTPKGRNSFYDICERAQTDDDWFYMRLRASETGIVAPDELADARASMTLEQYETEFECSFDSAVVGSYYGGDLEQARIDRRICAVAYDPAVPVHTVWDLGLDDATAVWFYQLVGKEIHLIKYREWTQQALTDICREVLNEPYVFGEHVFPHDIEARELTTGRSRIEVVRNIMGNVKVAPRTEVADGINAVRTLFPRMWFDEKGCAQGLECLRNYRKAWDEKRKVFQDRPFHDWASHGSDSLRYLALTYREQKGLTQERVRSKPRRHSAWAA